MFIIKIDPSKRIVARLSVRDKMKEFTRIIGKRDCLQDTLTRFESGDLPVIAIYARHPDERSLLWRLRGCPAIRGTAIIYTNAGFGPADAPMKPDWIKERILYPTEIGDFMVLNSPA